MVLVAFPSRSSHRGERLFGIGLAIRSCCYLVVHYVALRSHGDLLPPLIAAWSANVISWASGSLLLRGPHLDVTCSIC